MTASRPTRLVQRHMIRLRRSPLLLAAVTLLAAGALVALVLGGRPASGATPAGAAACAQWDVSGVWSTAHADGRYRPSFTFQQSGTTITGTATLTAAEQTAAGYTSPTGTVTGTIGGDQLDVVVTWSGRNGPVQGRYAGAVSEGRVSGMATAVGASTGMGWSGTGPTRCAATPSLPDAPAGAALPGHPKAFAWDFSDCSERDTRGQGTVIVDGARWNLPGGCHVQLLTPGQSTLEATFTLDAEPSEEDLWTLFILHQTPNGGDPENGATPVQITLNGELVGERTPVGAGLGPGDAWALTMVSLVGYLRRGENTLRWTLSADAAGEYWLKSFEVIGALPLPPPGPDLPPETPPDDGI
ncbi:MAG: hypothetical protein AB7R89_26835 [Dehalococcoidia bacterium]